MESPLGSLPLGSEVRLSPDQTLHLRKVLRLKEGDHCLITDGTGHEAEATVWSFPVSGEAVLLLNRVTGTASTPDVQIRLFPAMIQKAKIDFLVEKAQELEIQEIIPVETSWTVVKMNQAEACKAAERWQRLAREAAKQSGSLRLIKIQKPVNFSKAFEQASADGTNIIFHPGKQAMPFAEWTKTLSRGSRLNLFFGPEAGFTQPEIEQAGKKAKMVALTQTLLKADTAAFGVAAAIRFLFPC